MSKSKEQDFLTTAAPAGRRSVLPHLLGRSLFVALAAFTMIALSTKFEDLSYQNFVRDLKLDATVNVIEMRDRIETDIFERVLDLNEFATVLGQRPDMNLTEFNIKAVDFVLANPDVISVAAAPDMVVSMVFPSHNNRELLGLDFGEDTAANRALLQAVEKGEGHISGPITLSQNRRGLVMSKPVLTRAENGNTSMWGLLTIVIDYDKFLANVGLPEFDEEYDLLISEVGHPGLLGSNSLYGDPDIRWMDPIVLDFNFPFGHWEFSATLDGGWPLHRPNHVARMLERGLLIALCLGLLWFIMNLLDRRRRAEQLLSTGIEALDHGFVMFDADRRLVAFNKKYKQLAGGSGMVRIGARYEDIVKANLRKGLIPDAVGREKEWYDEWSKRLDDKAADKEQILADGRLIRAYDRPMEDGSVVGLRIDITDLKKAQIAAEAANKAKTDFMGVLSHELRTPLTVILGHAQLAKNIQNMPNYKKLVAEIEAHPELKSELMPKCEALSEQISKMMLSLERSGNHLFTLISEILDFAKIDSGTLSMDIEDVSTEDITDPVIDQMRPMVEQKGLELTVERATCDLRADTKRIQQILINLIGNASKFTDEGGITVKVVENDKDILFTVSDTGIGIPQSHLEKVFEAFHQVDNSSGRKYGGTGLGLAISRDIALAHGGDLTATSISGQGSTFTLRLPRPVAEATPMLPDEVVKKMVA